MLTSKYHAVEKILYTTQLAFTSTLLAYYTNINDQTLASWMWTFVSTVWAINTVGAIYLLWRTKRTALSEHRESEPSYSWEDRQ